MSNSVSPPWMAAYLISVAEKFGGDLSAVDRVSKGKKVQIIRFLTSQNPDHESWVWAVISDKQHSIPVRFSKEAVRSYMDDPSRAAESFTDLRTALAVVKDFRPMFTRVPLGIGRNGLSSTGKIALDIDSFDVKGSFGDNIWDHPKDVESVEDIRLWTEGLSDPHGGGGNVLKLRKQKEETSKPTKPPSTSPKQTVLPAKATSSKSFTRKSIMEHRHDRSREGPVVPVVPIVRKGFKRPYAKHLKNVYDNIRTYSSSEEIIKKLLDAPLNEVHEDASGPHDKAPERKGTRNALDMTSSPPRTPSPARERESLAPKTPSTWSLSPRNQQRSVSPEIGPEEDAMDVDNEAPKCGDDGGSHQSSPIQVSVKEADGRISSISQIPTNSSQIPVSLPESSPSPQLKHHPLLLPEQLETHGVVDPVPETFSNTLPPTSPSSPVVGKEPLRKKRRAGGKETKFDAGIVLCPNSDASVTASQSQGRSQSLPIFSSQIQPSQLLRTSQSLSYASDSHVPLAQNPQSFSQLKSQWSSQRQPEGRKEDMPSSMEVQAPNSSSKRSQAQHTQVPPSSQALAIPVSQLTIETWPSSEVRPRIKRSEHSPVESADSPVKARRTSSKSHDDEIQGEVEDVMDVEVEGTDELSTRAPIRKDQSTSADADDEAVTDQSSDDPDSHALEEEPEYVDEVDAAGEGTGDEHEEVDELDSDDEKTDAMVRQAKTRAGFAVTDSRPSVPGDEIFQGVEAAANDQIPSSPLSGKSLLFLRDPDGSSRPSSELPMLPSSPDVFLSDASFHLSQIQAHSSPALRSQPRRHRGGLTEVPPQESPIIFSKPTAHSRSPSVSEMTRVQTSAGHDGSLARRTVEQETHPVAANSTMSRLPSTHDAEAWRTPTFMREQKGQAKPSVAVRNHKRSASVMSERDQPPSKRLKYDIGKGSEKERAVEDRSPHNIAYSLKINGKHSDFDGLTHPTDSRRGVSVVSTASEKSQCAVAGPSLKPESSKSSILKSGASAASAPPISESSSSTSSARESDLRSKSRPLSKPRIMHGSRRAAESSTTQHPRPEHLQPMTSKSTVTSKYVDVPRIPARDKGKAVDRSGGNSVDTLSGVTAVAASGMTSRTKPPTGQDIKPVNGIPPVTWGLLKDILLRVGRARHKERETAKKERDRPG